jgi:hypothetical protein
MLPGTGDLCSDIATPATSSTIAATSRQNKQKNKQKNSLNVDLCYNIFMPLGWKIYFVSVSLWKIHHLPHCICAAIIWTVLQLLFFSW